MSLTNRQLQEIAIAKQIYLEQLKLGQRAKAEVVFRAFVRKFLLEVNRTLATFDFTNSPKRTFQRLIREIRDIEKLLRPVYKIQLLNIIKDVLDVEVEVQKPITDLVADNENEESIEEDKVEVIWTEVRNSYVPGTEYTQDEFVNTLFLLVLSRVLRIVKSAYSLKSPTSEVLINLSQIEASVVKRVAAVTDTAIQAVQSATFDFLALAARAGKTLWYIWLSVIDEVTTDYCIDHNFRVYEVGKGPKPPAHIRCRSTIAHYIKGVDSVGKFTLAQFFKTNNQPNLAKNEPITINEYKKRVRDYVASKNQ